MDLLSRTEEMILLAVHHLGNNAYGATIRTHVQDLTQKKHSVGAIYVPLDRLKKKGLLASHTGDPTPERGGRSKRYYKITSEGVAELQKIKTLQDTMWANAKNLIAPNPA